MEIVLENLSRSFGRQTVIDNLSHHLRSGDLLAVLGGNGSGKSTLLKIMQGSLTPSSGKLKYLNNSEEIPREKAAFQINLAGPYLELIEELTALEFLNFYQKFRKLKEGVSPVKLLQICLLEEAAHKPIQHFSSGMRQRLRLGLALLTKSQIVLLDEPTSNLDPDGVNWYRKLVEEQLGERSLVVGSNFNQQEMDFCPNELRVGHLGR